MYTPRHFAAHNREQALRIVQEYPFATLITSADGAPAHVTHLPLTLEEGQLWGHMARPNPHWPAFAGGRTVAIFHGPHQYISPRWYENPHDNVPTWNYAAVHVHGRPQILDAAGAQRVIERLTMRYESDQWVAPPPQLQRLLPGIVAFCMPLTHVEAKFKFSQNRSAADRAGVVARLQATGHDADRAVAEWIQLSND